MSCSGDIVPEKKHYGFCKEDNYLEAIRHVTLNLTCWKYLLGLHLRFNRLRIVQGLSVRRQEYSYFNDIELSLIELRHKCPRLHGHRFTKK